MEVINQAQRTILNNFSEIQDSNQFYLTGGTALAYFYLNHRRSNDLDFFTTIEETIIPFSYRLEEYLKSKGLIVQRQRGLHSFVEVLAEHNKETTIVHLALESSFRFEPTKEFAQAPKLKIDSLTDIAYNKILALFGRATLRDFIDIYFLVKKAGFTEEELMNKAKMKDPGFDLYWFGVSLERINNFKDDSAEMLLLLEKINFNELKIFFNKWREKIIDRLKKH